MLATSPRAREATERGRARQLVVAVGDSTPPKVCPTASPPS